MIRKLLVLLACIALLPTLPATDPKTSKSLAFATYKERVNRVTLLVGTFPAALNDHERYIPLMVGLGIRGKGPGMSITPESFILLDEDGNSYPMASYEEILANPKLLSYNSNLIRSQPLVTGEQFANMHPLRSSFFPERGIVVAEVNLERDNYMIDTFYFPRPLTGLHGVLTLRLSDASLEHPVNLRFEVPMKGKNQADKQSKKSD